MTDTMRIIYATDFSPASRVAFDRALRLTKATGGDFTIVHVLLTPFSLFMAGGYVTQETWDLIEGELRAHSGREMDVLVKAAADAGVRAKVKYVNGGVPADEIVRAAEEEKADILALGTHGRTGVTRMLMGSVASRVVATATCPVLTVRMPVEESR